MFKPFLIDSFIMMTIKSISEREEGPFYLYSVQTIRETCKKFKTIPYPEMSMHFASMANDNIQFLKIIKEESINVFVNSLMHLSKVQAAGFSREEIVFTASAMTPECMKRVHEGGAIVNHDSLAQVQAWRTLFPGSPLGIRCNIGSLIEPRISRGGYFLGKESRLGISIPDLCALYGSNDIAGLHVYVGTDIYDIRYFQECYETLARIALNFPNLTYIDFGGGFGADTDTGEEFNFATYGEMITSVMEKLCSAFGRRIRCILEPGRIIGAQSGYFVCKIIDVKHDGTHQLAGVNASAAQFPRPLFYPGTANHPVTVITERCIATTDTCQSRIYGCSTYSRDFLSTNAILPRLEIGDILVFGDAGAYCASSHTHFLGFPKAKEIFHGN